MTLLWGQTLAQCVRAGKAPPSLSAQQQQTLNRPLVWVQQQEGRERHLKSFDQKHAVIDCTHEYADPVCSALCVR